MKQKLALLKRLCEEITGMKVIITKWDSWSCFSYTKVFELCYDASCIEADDDPLFRMYCCQLDKEAAQRLDITLTVLHELGHWFNRNKHDSSEAREEYWRQVQAATTMEYYSIPEEHEATSWALQYIQEHQNQILMFEQAWQAA